MSTPRQVQHLYRFVDGSNTLCGKPARAPYLLLTRALLGERLNTMDLCANCVTRSHVLRERPRRLVVNATRDRLMRPEPAGILTAAPLTR